MAAESGSVPTDIDVNQDDPLSLTPLIRAIKDKNKVLPLLDNGADVNYLELKRVPRTVASSRYGTPICRYPIEFAAATSSLEIVKLLVERGATLEKTNALHAAAGGIGRGSPQERVKVMEFLLEKGFDINALEFAQEPEFPEQYESRIYGTPLHYAAAWGLEDRFEFLLQKGADPNILGYNYKTKEHWGTALDWQKLNEEDEGCYSERIRELLDDKAKE